MPLKLTIESRAVQSDIRTWSLPILDVLEAVLILVGKEVVDYLRSYTNEWRPPAGARGSSAIHRVRDKKGNRSVRRVRAPGSGAGGKRRAHPGHWADITGDLADKYDYTVTRVGNSVVLTITNSSGHAVYVEAMDGFFVLRGITDPGGPLDRKLRATLPKIAPNMKMV